MAAPISDRKPDQGNPLLFYIIVAVILIAFAAFFLLHPKASGGNSATHNTPSAPVSPH